MLVPIKYATLDGRNAAPKLKLQCYHGHVVLTYLTVPLTAESAFIVSIIQIGSDGSSMAMPRFPIVMAPYVNDRQNEL